MCFKDWEKISIFAIDILTRGATGKRPAVTDKVW
jgi:hypothetical protein